jgi:unsaturated rhamnogalacturonyl hydrolase
MKKLLLILMVGLMMPVKAHAQENIYSKAYIKNIIWQVNNYQINHPLAENDDIWIRGTYYTGVMASYQATGNILYLKQCNSWGEEHDWKIPAIEMTSETSGANAMTCSQTWLESYMIDKEKYKIQPTIEHLESPGLKNPVNCPLTYYYEGDAERYVDATFVCAPALAMLSKITGNPKYLSWMDSFFWDVYGALYSQEDNLFYRDQRFMYQKCEPDINHDDNARQPYIYKVTSSGKKVFWSRGNGWAFAALARILKYTPAEYVNYARYKELYVKMAIELKNRQQPDGFWYPNLDDPNDYGSRETSGTGFFSYGLAWGINNGILSPEEYLPIVEKSWKALVSAVSEEGKVQWGQKVAFSPHKILQEDTQEYVSGMFLLAASEMYKMGK